MLTVVKFLVIVSALVLGFFNSSWAVVRYVMPNHPNAADDGDGRVDRPYQTLSFAMKQLLPGDTLKLAAGKYRDSLTFPSRAWSNDRPTTIVGEENADVTIMGSDLVTGWVARGNGFYVKRQWMTEPQQVSLNGFALKQIGGTIFEGYPTKPGHTMKSLHASQGGIWPTRDNGSVAEMPPGAFYYDDRKKELVIRASLGVSAENLRAEVSTRPYLVQGQDIAGVTIQNIRFRYSNTTTRSRQGAVTIVGRGNTLDGLLVEDMDGVGIELSGDENTIRNCRVTRSGYLGIKARGRNVVIKNNEISYNNTRRFNKWWEAGGMKFVYQGGLHGSQVSGNRVHHNYGDGIWFDWGNDNNLVERNILAYNEGFGIHYEASSRAVIQDNEVYGNGQRGIYLIHSRESVVAHNLVVFNRLEGIAIVDEKRIDPSGLLDLRPQRNFIVGNLIGWNGDWALILPGEEHRNLSDGNLFLQERGEPGFSMGWPKAPSYVKLPWNSWRMDFQQDRGSVSVSSKLPRALRQSLLAGSSAVDWRAFDRIRGKFRTSIGSSGVALPEGVSFSGKAGPR
ncbi:MAG: right-handed parallel beta-helix repeat-containing protein [Candidatus Accumulibacter meliphilus]|jgi:parallel beta-helix repeat protein|uniref:right-handed parallel beta-helix repeat-containing protein n=1 Tax=Candidatus Accumulibacter meliphilus TaxID=2211374 RepID=UPI002FC2EA73